MEKEGSKAGTCRFCGQQMLIDRGEGMTDPQLEECATMQCSCDEAVAYQESAKRRETAKQRVKELFGEGAGEFKANEELQQIMCAAVDQICNKQAKQFVITIRSGVKCRIMQMAKDKIKVVREATSTSSFEQ